ncbi:DNA-binding response regulator [Kitasatospora herbaricolor]|uniref:response regulator transcription factor n=1 Tax=Kitasatospora herbaricolor TaxID=68217 RepID=UPI00174C2C00|nr:response regulator transcription factor [Kitasatospora herbaricolor]MDQ0309882.1 DNA-binding NarL/FixJ family response regulator [Kitasatospora herbaricolor]GGV32920.1 DNA-binding response regulator [Kitasatospora herbaricolor]
MEENGGTSVPWDPQEWTAHPRALVVDHWPLARTALSALLRESGAVGTVTTARSAEAAWLDHRETRADIVITDCDLRKPRDGLRLGRHLKDSRRPPMVLVYSEHNDPDVVFECLEGAADSFVHRSVEPETLVEAVRRLATGRPTWITSDQNALDGLGAAAHPAWPAGDAQPGRDMLTESMTVREREVLELLLRRYSNDEIATHLHLARQTVKNYVSTVMQKLEVSSRRELHGWARRTDPWPRMSQVGAR